MSEKSNWGNVLGICYLPETLEAAGVPMDGLIQLRTSDDFAIYPQDQFEVHDDGTIERREEVIALWNKYIQPAIDDGVVDAWTATGLLLQHSKDEPSQAELIAKDPAREARVERVGLYIKHTIARWSH